MTTSVPRLVPGSSYTLETMRPDATPEPFAPLTSLATPAAARRWPRGARGAPWVPGVSAASRELAEQLARIAMADPAPVLLVGEPGTGKGRVARRLHERGSRADRPFVEVNCAAHAPMELLSALAAGDPLALPSLAAGGTLFLDEIGELAPAVQARLVELLPSRAGIDAARLIVATSRDLANAVSEGAFPEELYYQLGVMSVQLPPLRARPREDVVALIEDIALEMSLELPEAPPAVSSAVVERLVRRPWSGNARELRIVLERALLAARGCDMVRPEHLPPELRERTPDMAHEPRSLADVEREHIERTLRAHRGNRTHAAKELGISRATLIKKVREYSLDVARGRRGDA